MSQTWKYKGLFSSKDDALSVLNGSTNSLALVGNTLYFYEDGALKEFLKDCHYKGDYASIDDVFEKYQYGCVSGDFISLSGDAYFWNADLNGWSANSSLAVEEGQRIAEETQASLPETVATTLTRFRGIFTSLDDATYLLSKDGAAGDFIAYKGSLYTWNTTEKTLNIYPASFHYRGTYDDMQTVETVFPTGGVRGHYVVIDGKAYIWNADKVKWVYGKLEDTTFLSKEILTIDKDVHVKGSAVVDGALEVGHDVTVHGNQTVDGTLKATSIDTTLADKPEKGGKGIYSSGAAYDYEADHIGIDTSTQDKDGIVGLSLRNRDNKVLGIVTKLFTGLSDADLSKINQGNSEGYSKLKAWIENELKQLPLQFLSRVNDDTASGIITFLKDIIVKGTVQSNDIYNSDLIRTKNLIVTGQAIFNKLVIAEVKAIAGANIQSAAEGFTVEAVVHVDGTNRTKLYWNSEKDGKAIFNMWKETDQALCMSFNRATTGTTHIISNKYYWVLVTNSSGAETEEIEINGQRKRCNWIEISGSVYDGTLEPEVGDEIVQLGYRGTDDPDRQNAIYESSYTSTLDPTLRAPFRAQYVGINEFKLPKFRKTYTDGTGSHVVGTISAITDAGYHLEIDSSMGILLDYGEVTTLTIKMCDALGKNCTKLATSWQITRDSGDTVNDAAWREKKKVKTFEALSTVDEATFDIAFTKGDNDLSETSLSTVFTISAYDRSSDTAVSAEVKF